jgi:hypothetical protein
VSKAKQSVLEKSVKSLISKNNLALKAESIEEQQVEGEA